MVRGAPLLLALSVWLSSTKAHAQEYERRHDTATWLGLMTDWQIKGPWSLWFDSHFNSRAFFVARPGITYRFESGPTFTGGYAFLLTDPGNGTLTRNEHRPWAQFFLPFRFSDDWSVSQRIRFDLRIQQVIAGGEIQEGWIVTPRWRSQTAATRWFGTKRIGDLFLQAALEVLVNGGPNAGPNYLDQNRISLVAGVKAGPTTFRAGYMDRFVPGKQGTDPLHEHNLILWVNYRFKREDRQEDYLPTQEGDHDDAPELGNP